MNSSPDEATTAEVLEAMGMTAEELLDTLETTRENVPRAHRDPRICLCGHGVQRHTVVNGIVYCKPTKMSCPCRKIRPVLEAQDSRLFVRKTLGAGPLHALALGIAAHVAARKSVRWIIDLACDRCGATGVPIAPSPVTQRGTTAPDATGYDALLCTTCRAEV